MSAKYIFVTGGVVSSLGKGLAAASIGCLLESRGLKVNLMKFDPYLNVDPGTMSPFQRNDAIDPSGKKTAGLSKRRLWGYRHLGLYVYRRDFLLKFSRLRPTALEQIESLEQLRALENGHRIYVAQVDERSVEVDTPADLLRAENYLKRRSN